MLRAVLPLSALLIGMSGLLLGNGLFGTLTALRMSLEAFDQTLIGIVVSAHSLGFVLGCFGGQRIIGATGHIRTFAAFAAIMAVCVLIMPITVQPATWIPLRAVFGFASAIVFMVAESWLAGSASPEIKGRVFSIYMVVNKGSFGAGQLLLLFGDPAGDRLFMLTAILYTICLVPIALARTSGPQHLSAERLSFKALYELSPVGVVAALITGFANASLIGLGPVFALGVGLEISEVSFFMVAFMLGSLAFQIPIGRLSDRFDRRTVLIGVAAAGAVCCGAMAFAVDAGAVLLFALSLIIGGLSATVYPIAMSHASDHADPGTMVSLMAGLLLAFGLGATVGPILASLLMAEIGPSGLYVFAAAMYLGLAAFTGFPR